MAPPPAKKAKTDTKSTPQISGDSLDQDFLLEDNFAPSDDSDHDDGQAYDPAELVASDDEDGHPHRPLPQSDDEDEDQQPAPKKRKAADREGATSAGGEGGEGAGEQKKKVKKEKKPKKPKAAKLQELGIGESEGLGLLPLAALVDALAEKQKRALPKLSNMEMDDLRLPESYLIDTSSTTERTNLQAFLRAAFPTLPNTLAKVPKKEGSPRLLVIAGAALRVADLCREVKDFKTKEVDVAKLFAKHFKLAEHAEYLNKTKTGIAVGTPNRIGKLLDETDSLHLTHLSHIILDATHLDAKKRSLVDMPEAREDLFKLVLGNKDIVERLKEGKCKIVIY
ncbi:U3-containing 90S pre-ribosomal complex subunit-domain containing protein [Leucosporidium creatinivorum]|uniref:U3-containing 90S pre-ribosomal complex subunit-domain containing protein n=1 Tax=Leucosporidium creatinivorum TaxID=106004 RepID=A0A1Y2C336_9BASI|nr:U3-containing 90S pre-ribosomal complex subunit-domain containing protein [Leucosporidium creatinivorum]